MMPREISSLSGRRGGGLFMLSFLISWLLQVDRKKTGSGIR